MSSRGDHRIAMLGAVAGLASQQGVEIEDPESVAVSFPSFFELVDRLRKVLPGDRPTEIEPSDPRASHAYARTARGAGVIVAIDGPAGAGKSSVASALSRRLGFRYLDTGAMYRALTWLALEHGTPLDDGTALQLLAAENPVEFGDDGRVSIAGWDVTERIREPVIDASVPVSRVTPR